MKGIILAGALGTRLGSVENNLLKRTDPFLRRGYAASS